jgi:hypothetical protein
MAFTALNNPLQDDGRQRRFSHHFKACFLSPAPERGRLAPGEPIERR